MSYFRNNINPENNDEIPTFDAFNPAILPPAGSASSGSQVRSADGRAAGARVDRGTQVGVCVVVAVLALCFTGLLRDIEPPRDMIGPDEYAHMAAGRLR